MKEGRVLQKVDQKHGSQSDRLVTVDDGTRELLWGHPKDKGLLSLSGLRGNVRNLAGKVTALELKDVIRIEYGRSSRAWVCHSQAYPWLCFSLYTTDRSFDFICPDEWALQCFVLVISRLCHGVNGAVGSRRKLQCLKGWCKVEDTCIKKKQTLARALLEKLKECRPRGDTEFRKAKNPFTFIAGDRNPFTFCAGADFGPESDEEDVAAHLSVSCPLPSRQPEPKAGGKRWMY